MPSWAERLADTAAKAGAKAAVEAVNGKGKGKDRSKSDNEAAKGEEYGLVDYAYGSRMTMANSEDELLLWIDGRILDSVAYNPSFPLVAGRSLERIQFDTPADSPASWCAADDAMSDGDFGSPSVMGKSCLP